MRETIRLNWWISGSRSSFVRSTPSITFSSRSSRSTWSTSWTFKVSTWASSLIARKITWSTRSAAKFSRTSRRMSLSCNRKNFHQRPSWSTQALEHLRLMIILKQTRRRAIWWLNSKEVSCQHRWVRPESVTTWRTTAIVWAACDVRTTSGSEIRWRYSGPRMSWSMPRTGYASSQHLISSLSGSIPLLRSMN